MSTAVGVLVSVALFAFTYRQTVGATRERARAATDELASGLIRLIVDEAFVPAPSDMQDMLDAQALTHRVSANAMPSVEQLRGLLLARLVLLEYVPRKDKSVLMLVLADAKDAADEPLSVAAAAQTQASRGSSVSQFLIGLASIAGGLVAVVLATSQLQQTAQGRDALLISLTASTAAVLLLFLVFRSRSGGSVSTSLNLYDYERQADHALRDLLNTLEIKHRVGGPRDGYDYKVWLGDEVILIELKHARRGIADAKRLAAAVKEEGAANGILVVDAKGRVPDVPGIRTMTFKEFLRFLSPDQDQVA